MKPDGDFGTGIFTEIGGEFSMRSSRIVVEPRMTTGPGFEVNDEILWAFG